MMRRTAAKNKSTLTQCHPLLTCTHVSLCLSELSSTGFSAWYALGENLMGAVRDKITVHEVDIPNIQHLFPLIF